MTDLPPPTLLCIGYLVSSVVQSDEGRATFTAQIVVDRWWTTTLLPNQKIIVTVVDELGTYGGPA